MYYALKICNKPEAGRAFQPGLSVTLENWCGKSVHSHPESRGE